MTASSLPLLTSIFHPAAATPGEITAATELARLAGASVAPTASAPPRGILVALASRNLVACIPAAPASPSVYASSEPAWTWIRIAASDSESAGATGEIIATHGAFLFAAVRLLANGVGAFTREKLAAGATLGDSREVGDALTPGDKLVLNPAADLKDGAEVQSSAAGQ